jgi:hypothetical protein
MTNNLSTFLKFPGIGNPDSQIWFIGIEEGGELSMSEINQSLPIQQKYFRDIVNESTHVWDIIAELIFEKYKPLHKFNSVEEFRKIMFSEYYSYFFLTQLFPLPNKNTSTWGENYQKSFGYEARGSEYLSDIHNIRYHVFIKIGKDTNLNYQFVSVNLIGMNLRIFFV